MTEKLDLAELERLCAAATPGPWGRLHDTPPTVQANALGADGMFPVPSDRTCNCAQVWSEPADCPVAYCAVGPDDAPTAAKQMENAALIVALRNAAPALLSRLHALERVAAAAKEYRLRERTGGGCDVKTTARLNAKIEAAREKLDESLKEAGL